MADLILRLRVDPATGRRTIVIDYASDADALPMEHEEQHRALAEKVLEGGLGGPGVEVSRETQAPATETAPGGGERVAEPTATKR
jgi:hypothetical protein